MLKKEKKNYFHKQKHDILIMSLSLISLILLFIIRWQKKCANNRICAASDPRPNLRYQKLPSFIPDSFEATFLGTVIVAVVVSNKKENAANGTV